VAQLLNVTSGRHQVRPVVGELFDRYPSPEAMAEGALQCSPRAPARVWLLALRSSPRGVRVRVHVCLIFSAADEEELAGMIRRLGPPTRVCVSWSARSGRTQ
jgi:hypothetical protein